ncbi:hypothetical protein ACUNV4_12730 [Granulosicoccus sp. 3-233]
MIIAPLLVAGSCVQASELSRHADGGYDPFGFNPAELDSIRFTRSKSEPVGIRATAAEERDYLERRHSFLPRQTEFSFKLKPKLPNFSREGAYGFDLFEEPRLDIHSRLLGPYRHNDTISELNDGLVYSAGVRIEHEDEDIDGTAYVSSSMLGLSYGRLGRLWYGGIDVNLEQFADDYFGVEQPDILSLDVTTGRRLGFTGLSTNSPLWLLSVQGNFDIIDEAGGDTMDARADWYLNPSLFWQQPGFTFSAQMQLPVEFETLDDSGEPDYRLRAVFEKQFK